MLFVRRARVPTALVPSSLPPPTTNPLEPALLCDLTIEGSVITSVGLSGVSSLAPSGVNEFDAGGALVFPGFSDAHVHLDKTHTWHRAPNHSGTFMEALTTLAADKENWTEEDLRRRAGFALRTAWAHGTRAIRTHVDTGLPWAEKSHAVMAALRDEWKDRLVLQTVPLCGGDAYATSEGAKIADLSVRHGASALGGFLRMSAELPDHLDCLLALAQERNLGIDLHVDENNDPSAECLRLVAEAVLRNHFALPVVCGHCCNLAVQDPMRARSTISLVREAHISVISLPLCNVYLQDRRFSGNSFPRSPLWRGLTLIHDLLDANVPVACASDNVRDAFYAFGDYDMLEVYTQSIRLAHLDNRLRDSVRTVTSTASDIMGLPQYGRIAPGAPAHLIIFEAHRFSELLSRPGISRRFIDGERVHVPALPDFVELNDRKL